MQHKKYSWVVVSLFPVRCKMSKCSQIRTLRIHSTMKIEHSKFLLPFEHLFGYIKSNSESSVDVASTRYDIYILLSFCQRYFPTLQLK